MSYCRSQQIIKCKAPFDSPQHHCVLEGDFNGPWLSSEFTVHLQSNLGGDTHEALGLAENGSRNALAGDCVLHAALGLDGLIVLPCNNIGFNKIEVFMTKPDCRSDGRSRKKLIRTKYGFTSVLKRWGRRI